MTKIDFLRDQQSSCLQCGRHGLYTAWVIKSAGTRPKKQFFSFLPAHTDRFN
ncbi:hypothetical protein PROFUN_17010, partial [Planoprotostelium fungivorum]